MNGKEFLEQTVVSLDDVLFEKLKTKLIYDYVPFSFLDVESINQKILAEKLYDYFEKIELKTGKSFESVVDNYISNLDAIISDRIAKVPKAGKNNPAPKMPRARKYYEKVFQIKKENELTNDELMDYSRVMLCLYSAIIKNEFNPIDDFDFSTGCLNLNAILEAVKNEKGSLGKKPRFNLTETYSPDQSTFVLMIIIYYYIKNNEIIGEY